MQAAATAADRAEARPCLAVLLAHRAAQAMPGSNGRCPVHPARLTSTAKGGAFDFRASLDDKGNFKQDWTKSLPDDLKASRGRLEQVSEPG